MNDYKNSKDIFLFNWVLKDKLAIGTSPTQQKDIDLLKKNKIKNVLGLCSELEAKWHKDLENSFSCIRVVLPDSNQNKLPSMHQIDNAYSLLRNFINKNITFIHCFASIERSPLLCIMYVMEEYNLDLEEALDYVKEVHKFTNPRNNQLFFIKDFLKKSNLI